MSPVCCAGVQAQTGGAAARGDGRGSLTPARGNNRRKLRALAGRDGERWPWTAALHTDLECILGYAAGADADPRTFLRDHRYGYDFATLAALVCGLAPWCILRRITPAAALKRSGSARVSGASRLRDALVLTQIALASALAVSGAQLIQSMLAAGRVDLGYRIDHVLAMAFDPAQVRADPDTRGFFIASCSTRSGTFRA